MPIVRTFSYLTVSYLKGFFAACSSGDMTEKLHDGIHDGVVTRNPAMTTMNRLTVCSFFSLLVLCLSQAVTGHSSDKLTNPRH
jgi:hypothetical protein